MPLSLRQIDRICITAVVLIGVSAAYLIFDLGAKRKRSIQRKNEMITQGSRDLDLAKRQLQYLTNSLQTLEMDLKSLKHHIPDSAEIGEFLKQLDACRQRNSITLLSVQPHSTHREKLYTRIPIRMLFKGSFGRVYRMLYELETMDPALVIEKMVMNELQESKECQVDLTANIFER
jgi:Tfp pilus assembly protein PilO